MKLPHRLLELLFVLALTLPALRADLKDQKDKNDGFVPMFNGKDLTGWVNVNCAPGTFYVKDKQTITTGRPTGYLRTEKQYENFIAEFEWMHVPAKAGAVGNSGFFVWADPIPVAGSPFTRGIEVQVLVNLEYRDKKTGAATASSHGDIFSIQGARCVPDRPHPLGWERCLPSENRARGANEWNHYRVEANDGVIKLAVNGKVVSGVSKCKPRKGYLALESEGSECRFRNLKIKELPSTNPSKDEIADEDIGFKSLYSGLDLSGWKATPPAAKHWQPGGTVLHFEGQADPAKENELRSLKEFGDCELIVDFRFPKGNKTGAQVGLRWHENTQVAFNIDSTGSNSFILSSKSKEGILVKRNSGAKLFKHLKSAGQWNRLRAALRGRSLKIAINGKEANADNDNPSRGAIFLRSQEAMDFANLFVRELKK